MIKSLEVLELPRQDCFSQGIFSLQFYNRMYTCVFPGSDEMRKTCCHICTEKKKINTHRYYIIAKIQVEKTF